MAKFETNQIDVNDDGRIILYQRPDVTTNPKWQCRSSVAGATGYKIFSTKETDQRKAERVAVERYEELYFKVRRGGALKGKPFKDVVQEYKDSFGATVSLRGYNKDNIRRVELLADPFFKTKSIDEITESDLSEMMSELDTIKYSTSTIRHYRMSVSKVFNFAKTKGYIETIPPIAAPSLKKNPRPDFTEEDWKKLTTYMREWVISNTKGERGKGGLDHKRFRERFYLQQYILIMANTGIRIGEMRGVRWIDLSSVEETGGDERLLFAVDGKTGKRSVVANAGVERYIKRLWEFRSKEIDGSVNKREFIFCHPNGKSVGSYTKGFQNLLHECDLRVATDGMNRTLYSLRHTYATMRINEVSVYQLAVNMGTSVEMIENYYSHARTSDPSFVSAITKGNQKSSGKALPF